jgi:adenylate cyclase
MPFQNMGGDPQHDYFADGIVEDIITALSRMPWLFVIARNSSLLKIGLSGYQDWRELVRYLLQGSVRRSGDRIRITGQLIEAETGTHLWADRFDGELEDIFALQDDIASSIVASIEPKMRTAEAQRAILKPTTSLQAYDHFLRALAAFHQLTKKSLEVTLAECQRQLSSTVILITYGLAAVSCLAPYLMDEQGRSGAREAIQYAPR